MEEIKKFPKEWRAIDVENCVCHGVCPQICGECMLEKQLLTFEDYLRFCCRPIIIKEKPFPS